MKSVPSEEWPHILFDHFQSAITSPLVFLKPTRAVDRPLRPVPEPQVFCVVKLRHVSQTHARPTSPPAEPQCPPPAPSCHSAVQFMSRVLQRLREVDQHVSEIKAQTQQTREFHTKSIKEKAVHLTGMFSSESSAVSKGGVRRTIPQSADRCRSCDRRVYLVERVSVEGLFFHRECFRCSTCSSTLRLGAHALDTEQGKLYCQLHFDQRNNGTNLKRTFSQRLIHNRGEVADNHVSQELSGTPEVLQSPTSDLFDECVDDP